MFRPDMKIWTQKGIATLEAAITLILLASFITGAMCVVDYVSCFNQITKITDKVLYDSNIKPLEFQNNLGNFSLELRHAEIREYTADLLQQTALLMSEKFHNYPVSESNYLIEAAYAEVLVDPHTGAPAGLASIPFSYSVSSGSLGIPAELLEDTDLGIAFEQHASLSIPDSNGRYLYAVPTALFGQADGQRKFLSRTVLIGLRAFFNLGENFTGKVYQDLGGTPIVYDSQVIVLRGELDI